VSSSAANAGTIADSAKTEAMTSLAMTFTVQLRCV
jgi:hypothetical protein